MKVSVIMSAYNCEKYIADAIQSVLDQTERDLELIVVDDGSTDRTLEIAVAMARCDKRIQVLTQKNSGTPSVGRNRGIRAARGEFICFLDADDLYHQQKIERELTAFSRFPTLDVVFGDLAWFEDGKFDPSSATGRLHEVGVLSNAKEHLENSGDKMFLCRSSFFSFMSTRVTSVTTQTVMIRASRLHREATWFREDWSIGEDIDLWFRLAIDGRLCFINEVLAYYRQHPNSLMKNSEGALLGFIRTHSANLERAKRTLSRGDLRIMQSRLANQFFHLGYLCFAQGRMTEARTNYRRARELSSDVNPRLSILKTYVPFPIIQAIRSFC